MIHVILNLAAAIGIVGLIISTLGLVLARFVTNRHAMQHAILKSALLGLLIAPAFAAGYSYWNISWLRLNLIARAEDSKPINRASLDGGQDSSSTDNKAAPSMEMAERTASSETSDKQQTAQAIATPNQIPRDTSVAASSKVSSNLADAVLDLLNLRSPISWAPITITVWFLGIALCLLRLAGSVLGVVRLRKLCIPIPASDIREARTIATKTFPSLQSIPLVQCSGIQSPLVLGVLRPLIVLPLGLVQRLNSVETADILIHETAHVQRRDNFIILLERIAASIYWPIPTVHWLNQRLKQAREELCDNFVLRSRDAIDYGQTLGRLAEIIVSNRSPSLACGMFRGAGKLESRITSLVQCNRDLGTHTPWYAAASLLAVFVGSSTLLASCSLFAQQVSDDKVPVIQFVSSVPVEQRDISTPEFAGNYFGQVFDVDGKPLAGAKIYVMKNPAGSSEQPKGSIGPVRAITDENGRFDFYATDMTYQHFDGLTARREGLLVAVKEGYGADWQVTWRHASEQGSHWNPYKLAKLDFHLAKSDVLFRGRLIAPNGQPLAGAKVRIQSIMTPRDRKLDEFLSHWQTSGTLGGFLSSGPTFENTIYTPEYLPDTSVESVTDEQGDFKFAGLPHDRLVYLHITSPEIVDTTIMAIVRDAAPISPKQNPDSPIPVSKDTIYGSGFVLNTDRGLTINGRVIDKDTKQPVANMWVGPLRNIVTTLTPELYPWRTDSDGRFSITGLSPTILQSTESQPHYQMIVASTTPGLPYETAWSYIKPTNDGSAAEELVIEVKRGIPFHLKIVDNEGKPVDAEVSYQDIVADNRAADEVIYPIGTAAKNSDGTYSGFVLPGPGAILVKTRWQEHFRPAKVDPNAFFGFSSNGQSDKQNPSGYGTLEQLFTHQGRYLNVFWRTNVIDQRDYTAILLVNPPADSSPLELTATLHRYQSRRVYFLGPDGKPISDVQATVQGNHSLTDLIRGNSYQLADLTEDRDLEVTYSKTESGDEKKELVALLFVRENGAANAGHLETNISPPDNNPRSIAVQLHKPAGFAGRLVDQNNQPVEGIRIYFKLANSTSYNSAISGKDGRFVTGTIYPGHAYETETQRPDIQIVSRTGRLVLQAGETRDVGDIILKLPATN